jgi:hypothetical protein
MSGLLEPVLRLASRLQPIASTSKCTCGSLRRYAAAAAQLKPQESPAEPSKPAIRPASHALSPADITRLGRLRNVGISAHIDVRRNFFSFSFA